MINKENLKKLNEELREKHGEGMIIHVNMIDSFRDMWLSKPDEVKLYRLVGFDEERFPILIPWKEKETNNAEKDN